MDILIITLCGGVAGFLKFYIVALTLRVYLTWFPNINFYDYTKIQKRALKFARGEYPPNYHLTYSLNEDNYDKAMQVLN